MNWFTEIVCAPRWTSLAWVMFGIAYVVVAMFERRDYFKRYSKALSGLIEMSFGMNEITLRCIHRAVLLDEFNKALERIATIYDWHDRIPDDNYVGESDALCQCVEIAEKALG